MPEKEEMSDETRAYLKEKKVTNRDEDWERRLAIQAARPKSNRLVLVAHLVHKFMDNRRRWKAGDPTAIPISEFKIRID